MKQKPETRKLEIIDLHVEVEGKEIIKGITLTFFPGKIHALMGPNGSGKSTLANALMGHPKCKIMKGKVILDGKDITREKTTLRAQQGLFLSFQNPPEINGVAVSSFLRTAVNNLPANTLQKKKYSPIEFHKLLLERMSLLKIEPSFTKRHLNEGFSGGEKKRMEILQMLLLNPKYILLDETDSGLDVDAIKIIAGNIAKVRKENGASIIVISHHPQFLNSLAPDEVSVMVNGKIVSRGGKKLAAKIGNKGFSEWM